MSIHLTLRCRLRRPMNWIGDESSCDKKPAAVGRGATRLRNWRGAADDAALSYLIRPPSRTWRDALGWYDERAPGIGSYSSVAIVNRCQFLLVSHSTTIGVLF